MKLYEIDPTKDARWLDLIGKHPDSSVFHTPGWLEALRRAYRYEPVAFTDSAPGQTLGNGWLFCRIKSWMTGQRLVSLPFSDHCAPLARNSEALVSLLEKLKIQAKQEKSRYVEVRPHHLTFVPDGFKKSETFCSHTLDLRPHLEAVFSGFHKSCVQRTIRRANRLGVICKAGRSRSLLDDFYALQTSTRCRHCLPTQPLAWFRSLVECLGQHVTIYVANYQGRAIAAIFTMRHGTTLTYKYGGSDARYHRCGAMPLLFWKAIQDAKALGLMDLDLGRSDTDDEGLINFKDHLGAERTLLNYYRHQDRLWDTSSIEWPRLVSRIVYPLVPKALMARAGSSLYRHFG